MGEYYTLNGHEAVPCDLETYCKLYDDPKNKRVALTHINDETKVSTVFLGLNHNYGDGPPMIFETMIFGSEHDEYQERYSTWDEAVAGHEKAVELAK